MLIHQVGDGLPSEGTPLVVRVPSSTTTTTTTTTTAAAAAAFANRNATDGGGSFAVGLKEIFLGSMFNVLMPCIPLALVARYCRWSDGVILSFALLGLLTSSERLGYITRQISIHTNTTVGAILNATFGNLSEIVVAISGLSQSLLRLVQLSLLGSILVNLLLMLGSALVCGGLHYRYQLFSKIGSQMNTTLLVLAAMCMMFPAMLNLTAEETRSSALSFSRASSVFLIGLYGCFLYFQLRSHSFLYDTSRAHGYDKLIVKQRDSLRKRVDYAAAIGRPKGYNPTVDYLPTIDEGEEGVIVEKEIDILGFSFSIFWLLIFAASTILLSDTIAVSFQGAAIESNISAVFLAGVILPVVGDFAEGASCIRFALEGSVDRVINVAVGSSTQMALVVVPLIVIIAWCMDKELSFDMGLFESLALFTAVIGVTFVIKDGVSNYMLGVALLACYAAVAIAFFAEVNQSLSERHFTHAVDSYQV